MFESYPPYEYNNSGLLEDHNSDYSSKPSFLPLTDDSNEKIYHEWDPMLELETPIIHKPNISDWSYETEVKSQIPTIGSSSGRLLDPVLYEPWDYAKRQISLTEEENKQPGEEEDKQENEPKNEFKNVLKNISHKVLSLNLENKQYMKKQRQLYFKNDVNIKRKLNYLKNKKKELTKELSSRGGLAKSFHKGEFKLKLKKAKVAKNELNKDEADFIDLGPTLKIMYQKFIVNYGISYLTHSKVESAQGCYLKTFSTVLNGMKNPKFLNNLKK